MVGAWVELYTLSSVGGQTSMSIMVGWMGVMVGDGDRSIARASIGDGGRRIIDGGGAVTAGGLAVAEAAVSEGGRGVDDILCSDGRGDGADLPDGDRRTKSDT